MATLNALAAPKRARTAFLSALAALQLPGESGHSEGTGAARAGPSSLFERTTAFSSALSCHSEGTGTARAGPSSLFERTGSTGAGRSDHFERTGRTEAGPNSSFERLGSSRAGPSSYFEGQSGSGALNSSVFEPAGAADQKRVTGSEASKQKLLIDLSYILYV